MSLIDQMREALPELSKNERKVAEHFIEHPYEAQRAGVDAAANACGVSRSSVIRFCHKLGFKGYSEFRYTLMQQGTSVAPASGEAGASSALDAYALCLGQLRGAIAPEQLDRIAELLSHAHRIISMGLFHSGMSAAQLAFRLNRIGIDCQSIDDSTITNAYINILKAGDVVVVFSISGQSDYAEMLAEYRRHRVSVVLVTMTPSSPASRNADHTLVIPSALRQSEGYLLDEALPFFFAIELLVEATWKKMVAFEGER